MAASVRPARAGGALGAFRAGAAVADLVFQRRAREVGVEVGECRRGNVGKRLARQDEGSNMYGKISLIAGFDETTKSFISMYLVKNEQTYASTLVEKYVNPVNKKQKDYETDVSCGATYGAKLVRDMINDAKKAANDVWSK